MTRLATLAAAFGLGWWAGIASSWLLYGRERPTAATTAPLRHETRLIRLTPWEAPR